MENSIIQNIDQKMGKTIDALKKDFVSIKAGRANPNILDNIFVDYYGSSMPINQLANITTPDSQLLVIVPWEKAAAKEIEKSIYHSTKRWNSHSSTHSSFNKVCS